MSQNPSSIGPGAVSPFNPYGLNNAYTMAYGEDRDPYGAQMPYRIGYDTYTPNYPSIPGVPNSFAPGSNPYAIGLYQGSMPAQTPGTSTQSALHASDPATASNGHVLLAQPPSYDMNNHHGFANAMQQARGASGAPNMPSMMAHTDPSRSNYSFGPRAQAPQVTRAGPVWDRNGRMNGASREPGFPSPIGTRPPQGADENSVSVSYLTSAMGTMDMGPSVSAPHNNHNGGNNHAALHRYISSLPNQPNARVDSAHQNS